MSLRKRNYMTEYKVTSADTERGILFHMAAKELSKGKSDGHIIKLLTKMSDKETAKRTLARAKIHFGKKRKEK